MNSYLKSGGWNKPAIASGLLIAAVAATSCMQESHADVAVRCPVIAEAFLCQETCVAAILDMNSREYFNVHDAYHPMGDKNYAVVRAYSPYVGSWDFQYVWDGNTYVEDGRVPGGCQ